MFCYVLLVWHNSVSLPIWHFIFTNANSRKLSHCGKEREWQIIYMHTYVYWKFNSRNYILWKEIFLEGWEIPKNNITSIWIQVARARSNRTLWLPLGERGVGLPIHLHPLLTLAALRAMGVRPPICSSSPARSPCCSAYFLARPQWHIKPLWFLLQA